MPTAYSYLRMSRPEQLRGDSLRRQLEASRAYAAEHGLTLDEEFRDIGVSAFDGKNHKEGALSKFLEMIGPGRRVEPGSFLLVESLDRISREHVADALELFLSIIRRGITIVTLADGCSYSREAIKGDFTKLIASIVFMARAHEESATKSKRLRAAWAKKRRELGNTQKRLTSRRPAWLDIAADGLSFEPIEERVQIVERIFRESASGIGAMKIAQRLNAEGVPTFAHDAKRRSRGWQASYIKKILDSEAVLGKYQLHVRVDGKRRPEGMPVNDYFPPIIPDDLFWQEKHARKARLVVGAGQKGVALNNLFTGIAKCGNCDGPMHYINKGPEPKGGRYLRCDAARRGAGCDQRNLFRYDFVEYAVVYLMASADVAGLLENERAGRRAIEEELERAEAQLFDKKKRRDNLSNMAEEANDPDVRAALAPRVRALQQEITSLETSTESLRHKIRSTEAVEDGDLRAELNDQLVAHLEAINRIEDASERYRARAALSRHFHRFVERIMFYPDAALIHFRNGREAACIFEIEEWHPGPDMPSLDELETSGIKLNPIPVLFENGRARRGRLP